jgi:uncharacterized protein (TIGR01244 family)
VAINRIPLRDNFSVSAQVAIENLPLLADQGVKSIICNRPDGGANDQPTVAEIQEAAKTAGIKVAYVPVVSGSFCAADIADFSKAMNAPNAKTAAAARMQAPIVANDLLQDTDRLKGVSHYNGYGSCPLTVKRGKIVLAEFGYGGKLLPSFPRWLINGERPSRLAWILKEKILPPIYWKAMLKGRDWMVNPQRSKADSSKL